MQFRVRWTGEPSSEDVVMVIAYGAGFGMNREREHNLHAEVDGKEYALVFEHPDDSRGLDHGLDRVRRIQDHLLRYGAKSTFEVDGKTFPVYVSEVFEKLCSMRAVVQQVVSDLRATRGMPLLRDKRIAAVRIRLEKVLS